MTVVVARQGATADELSFELPRKQVQLRDVSLAAMMPNGVGYIQRLTLAPALTLALTLTLTLTLP